MIIDSIILSLMALSIAITLLMALQGIRKLVSLILKTWH